MTDQELTLALTEAFLPFAKGLATKPGSVTLGVTCSAADVHGVLSYAPEDHVALTQGSMADVDLGRAFRFLAQWLDGRRPSLVVQAAA